MKLMHGFPTTSDVSRDPSRVTDRLWPLYYNYHVLAFFVLHRTDRYPFSTFCVDVMQESAYRLEALLTADLAPIRALSEVWCEIQNHLYRYPVEHHDQPMGWLPSPSRTMWTMVCPDLVVVRRDIPFDDATTWTTPSIQFELTVNGWSSRAALTPYLEQASREARTSPSATLPYHIELADPETVRHREQVCRSCEWFDATQQRCTKCGCGGAKLRLKKSTCPVGKW